jgi:hypothetical protein
MMKHLVSLNLTLQMITLIVQNQLKVYGIQLTN